MAPSTIIVSLVIGLFMAGGPLMSPAFAQRKVLDERSDAVVDLMTTESVQLVQGQWRYSDAKVVEVDHQSHQNECRWGATIDAVRGKGKG